VIRRKVSFTLICNELVLNCVLKVAIRKSENPYTNINYLTKEKSLIWKSTHTLFFTVELPHFKHQTPILFIDNGSSFAICLKFVYWTKQNTSYLKPILLLTQWVFTDLLMNLRIWNWSGGRKRIVARFNGRERNIKGLLKNTLQRENKLERLNDTLKRLNDKK